MLILPTPKLIWEFTQLREPLGQIMSEVLETLEYQGFWKVFGQKEDLIVSSIFRPDDAARSDRSGIHSIGPPFRAIDIPMEWEWVGKVAKVINKRWIYDASRPKLRVIVTKQHGTGPHLHAQVHPNTILRSELQMGLQV